VAGRFLLGIASVITSSAAAAAAANVTIDHGSITVGAGAVAKLEVTAGGDAKSLQWTTSNPRVAQVYANGTVVGIAPGEVTIIVAEPGQSSSSGARCDVTVQHTAPPMIDVSQIKQYPDNRVFRVDGRKCVGSELNGQRNEDPEERKFTQGNRVINPKPLDLDKPVDWEVEKDAEVVDGAGVLIGKIAPTLKVPGGNKIPVAKFNFGMSKVLGERLCVYAFSVRVFPSPIAAKLIGPKEMEGPTVATSGWMPIDRVIDKLTLLDRIGLGKVKLPRLPLEERGFVITGGNPHMYDTEVGEMTIVKDPDASAHPSDYLRRTSGTVNIIYSVPGFGLGGQSLDSFLVSDGIVFHPAKGAKTFTMPTYFPAKHPRAGKASTKTETFVYGAVEVMGSETVYGWVAREALGPVTR
jgi:hypothetical protein